jgi:hypothetical protein
LAGETEVLGENLLQWRFVHHKSPHAARTRTRAAAVGSQRLTAELRHGLRLSESKESLEPAEHISYFACLQNILWVDILVFVSNLIMFIFLHLVLKLFLKAMNTKNYYITDIKVQILSFIFYIPLRILICRHHHQVMYEYISVIIELSVKLSHINLFEMV